MFSGRSSLFDRSLDKATSQLLLEPDWDSILQICDAIRQGDVQAKYAVGAVKKKITNENPHVSMFALQVLESITKNCGQPIHEEIATKEFMEFFKDQLKKRNDPVKGKILELTQVWSHAFRNEQSYKIVQDTYNLLKLEGYSFPALKEADAMFMADKAPEWKDGDCCHRCRVQFSTFQRKHHCRNCGQVFCGKCSSKNSIIPRFGIEREVRVCDSCFDQLNKTAAGGTEDQLPAEYLKSPLSQQQQTPPQKSEEEIREEEELQLALALSASEAAAKDKERNRLKTNYSTYSEPATKTEPQAQPKFEVDTSDMDPELAKYLNRNYWQQKQDNLSNEVNTTQPSAPVATNVDNKNSNIINSQAKITEKYQNGESSADEQQFLNAVNSSVEIFVNRMKSNSMRGRSIANDSSVQTLFSTLTSMHPQLMQYIAKQEEMRTEYESLQDKLAQLKDAREALDALREEQQEKRRREREELERQRAIAMAQKLDVLRQKKQEYLEYQRQLAMQRMEEQKREMEMRLEQQKHMQHMKAMNYNMAQASMMYPGAAQGFSPAGSTEGSPMHHPAHQYGPPHMSMPPGAPGAQSVHMPGNAQPPSMVSSMYGGAAPGAYPPPPPGGYQMQGPAPGGYAPPGAYQPPPQGGVPQGGVPQGGVPQGGVPQGGPPPGQPPPGAYAAGGPQPNDYQNFNMQGMSAALPQSGPAHPGNAPPQQQFIPQQPYMPPQQQGPPPQQAPPPGAQPAQQYSEAELISFD